MADTVLHGSAGTFRHEALLYGGADEFLDRTLPFIEEGIGAGEGVLVALPPANLRRVRTALGERHGAELVDMERVGRNPGSIISVWNDFVTHHAAVGRPARGVAEPVWAARTPLELDECMIHEALLNVAFVDGPAWQLMCPYDTTQVSTAVLDRALSCHPAVRGRDDGCYRQPAPAELLAGPVDPPTDDVTEVRFDAASLRELRGFVTRFAQVHAFGERIDDLVLAVNELATNSIDHGDGEGTVSLWAVPGGLVCEVRDRGRIDNPLIGRKRAALEQENGRGMWLVHQLCDLVQLRSSADGTVVQVRMAQPGT